MKKINKSIFSIFLLIIYMLFTSNAHSAVNCTNCGQDGAFGSELRSVYPEDPFFYSKNFSLSCKRSNGTRWTNRFSGYINSEYVYALENSKEHVTLVIGYLTKDKKQLKMRGIKKWLPGNDLDTYEFVSNLKKDIITTLETKI